METKQRPDIKAIYGTAAEAVLAGFVTVEKAADDIVRMYGLDTSATEKVRSKITGRCGEIRIERTWAGAIDRASGQVAQSVAATGSAMTEIRASTDGDVSITVKSGGSLDAGALKIDLRGEGRAEAPAPHPRQALLDALSFEGLPMRSTTFGHIEVDICSTAWIAERVRMASAATDSNHEPLRLVDVVLSAYDSRKVDIEAWNKWTPRRRAAVVAAELELLQKAAEGAVAQGANTGTPAALGDGVGAAAAQDDGSNSAGGQANTQGE